MTTRRETTRIEDAETDALGRPYFVGAAYGPQDAVVHRKVMERLQSMTPEEFLESLVAAGIYSSDGRLMPTYADDLSDEVPLEVSAAR